MRTCTVEGCEKKHKAHGLCRLHYLKKRYREEENYRKKKDEASAKWFQRNKNRALEYNKKWKKDNHDKRLKTLYRYQERRLKQIALATPPWVDRAELEKIYKNCPPGFATDHAIPILSRHVCGLEVPWNLQYLPIEENKKKRNKYEGMPE